MSEHVTIGRIIFSTECWLAIGQICGESPHLVLADWQLRLGQDDLQVHLHTLGKPTDRTWWGFQIII